MGRFVNPGNHAFQDALNSEIYVDKTGLLEYTNKVMDTTAKFICNSRPRRFGKSMTVDMLTAYYGKGDDSEKMFAGLRIGKSDSFKAHLNRYDVIVLDIQWCMLDAGSPEATVSYIHEHLIEELTALYPDVPLKDYKTAYGLMSHIHAMTGKKFIVIIDEWDVLIRDEAANHKVQEEYIDFLRGMFKGSEPTKFIHLAYLTGILPIKKIKTQSALNNFSEFTMLDAKVFAKYVGFTEDEVRTLCVKYGRDFERVKRWYDGYVLRDYHVYNPRAVVEALIWDQFQSYWSETGTYEAIVPLINMDFDGLKTAVIEMLSGASVKIDTSSFQNDMVSFANRDDVLTYLIHLGYLAYNQEEQTTFIPNEEVRLELANATKRRKWDELIAFWRSSEALLTATLEMDEAAVAHEIEVIHQDYVAAISYNNENSLSSVLAIGYLSAMQYYFKPVREMPAGRGFADFIFVPKIEHIRNYPALVIELKWNQDAQTAIRQIKDRKYPEALEQYTGNILLVDINYDKRTKQHQCKIEMLDFVQ